VLLRSGFCADISPKPVSRELTPAGTSAHRRLFSQVDSRREMRPIAFVDPGSLVGMNPENASNFCIARLLGGISVNSQRQTSPQEDFGTTCRASARTG